MLSAVTTHAPTTYSTAFMMESSSERQTQQWRHSQVTDYTMESTMPCWSDKTNTICYIHNVYKHIWGTKKYFVYLLTTLYKSVWHTSIANLSKRIHNSSPETLVYFFSNSENAQEGVREQDFLRQPNVLLQRKVYIKINTRRHIQCEKTAGLYMERTWWRHHAVCTWESCLTQQLWPTGR